MANIKISELTVLTPPDAADLVPVTDSSASQTKRTTVGEIVGIVNGDVDVADDGTATISELPVSKLQDGAARQLLQTDAAGTGVEWTDDVDLPGTLDVTGAATLDSTLNVNGQSTLSSAAVSDLTEDRVVIAGASGELEDSANLTFDGSELGIIGTLDVSSNITAASFIPTSSTVPTNGVYLPSANELGLATNSAQALYINSDGDILVADGNRMEIDEIRARDGDGLNLFDDGGAGIFIEDGGNVGVGSTLPYSKFTVQPDSGTSLSYNVYTGDGVLIQNSNQTNTIDSYGGGIAWTRSTAGSIRKAAICSVQTTSDQDPTGLAFLISSSTSVSGNLYEGLRLDHLGNLVLTDGGDLALGTTTGTQIGTASTQKLAFYGATPIVQPSAISDLSSSATSGTLPVADGTITIADASSPTNAELLEYCVELEAKLESALSALRQLGIIQT